MRQKLEKALVQSERNQNEYRDIANDYQKEDTAVRNLEQVIATLKNDADWMPPEDLKLKEAISKKELQSRKDNRYRIELKKIKAETILSIIQGNLREAERLIELAIQKFPWS